MYRKIALVLIPVGVLVLATVILLFSSPFLNPSKLEVSGMALTYEHGLDNSTQAIIDFTVSNTYHSYMTGVGVTVDGVDYGLSTLQINPGETQEKNVPLNDLTLSNSETYLVKLTFAFADQQYQIYLESYTVKGQAAVTYNKLVKYFNGYIFKGAFDCWIQNTGNLPFIEAQCTVDGSNPIVSRYRVFPGETLRFAGEYPVDESSYPVTIQLKYLDESTSTIETSVNVTEIGASAPVTPPALWSTLEFLLLIAVVSIAAAVLIFLIVRRKRNK